VGATAPDFHIFLPQMRMGLVDHFMALHDRGVERFYTWFSDFADPETLAALGAEVIQRMAPHGGARPWT
jgi:hypothetical protein